MNNGGHFDTTYTSINRVIKTIILIFYDKACVFFMPV